MFLNIIQRYIPVYACNVCIHRLREENATLNSSIVIWYGSSLLAQRESEFPSRLTICEILKLPQHTSRVRSFCPQSPLSSPEVGRQAAHTALQNEGFSVAPGKQPQKHLGKKYSVQSRKLMLTSDVQMWVGKALIYFRQDPVIFLSNTVVNLNKIKKRSNPVDKCFH